MKILTEKQGFTLIEIMVALAISSIITAAMYSAYTGLQRINHDQAMIVEMQQNLRAGLDMMVRELRMAGYDPDKRWNVGFTTASAQSIIFTKIVDEGTPAPAPGTLQTIQYAIFDGYAANGVNDIGRQADAGNPIVLIENVERLEFLYTLDDGTQLPAVDSVTGALSTTPLTAAELNRIRSVQISVLARAPGISQSYRDSGTYTSAAGMTWGPFNDNVRRRMQILNVNCRNMGW